MNRQPNQEDRSSTLTRTRTIVALIICLLIVGTTLVLTAAKAYLTNNVLIASIITVSCIAIASLAGLWKLGLLPCSPYPICPRETESSNSSPMAALELRTIREAEEATPETRPPRTFSRKNLNTLERRRCDREYPTRRESGQSMSTASTSSITYELSARRLLTSPTSPPPTVYPRSVSTYTVYNERENYFSRGYNESPTIQLDEDVDIEQKTIEAVIETLQYEYSVMVAPETTNANEEPQPSCSYLPDQKGMMVEHLESREDDIYMSILMPPRSFMEVPEIVIEEYEKILRMDKGVQTSPTIVSVKVIKPKQKKGKIYKVVKKRKINKVRRFRAVSF